MRQHHCVLGKRQSMALDFVSLDYSGLMPLDTELAKLPHPGPETWLGTVNPSGVMGKESIIAQLPSGTWGLTERRTYQVRIRCQC